MLFLSRARSVWLQAAHGAKPGGNGERREAAGLKKPALPRPSEKSRLAESSVKFQQTDRADARSG